MLVTNKRYGRFNNDAEFEKVVSPLQVETNAIRDDGDGKITFTNPLLLPIPQNNGMVHAMTLNQWILVNTVER